MKQALFFPAFDALSDPGVVADVAAAAETAGWDGIFLWDHMLYSSPARDIADPWVTLSAVAVATSRVQIGAMVTPLSRRRPAVVARQAVSLDRLSGGRLVLGFGLGDDGRIGEMSRLGEEAAPAARAALLDEGLEVLTGLLSGQAVVHKGDAYVIDDVAFTPVAARPGGIPIWLAARWPNRAPMRRAARYDGLFAIQLERPDDVARLRETVTAEGADPTTFTLVAQGVPDDDPTPWADAGLGWWMVQYGPYDMTVDELRSIAAAGPKPVAAR